MQASQWRDSDANSLHHQPEKKLVPYKAKSVKEFAEAVKKEGGCRTVVKRTYQDTERVFYTAKAGIVARFRYMVEFSTRTSSGRMVRYTQFLFDRSGSERGPLDVTDRLKASIRQAQMAEIQAKELKSILPDIEIGDPQNLDDLIY